VKLKLDENLPTAAGAPLSRDGHDVTSVPSQNMEGSLDPDLIEVCRQERRCLVTLDIEFGNPLIYDPSRYAGIALIRIPGCLTRRALLDAVSTLSRALQEQDIIGKLWVVQPGRIREYQQD
jgi:predicted nuclease of predicted toxin-antitoxin system